MAEPFLPFFFLLIFCKSYINICCMNFKEACDILGVSSEVTEEKLKFFFS